MASKRFTSALGERYQSIHPKSCWVGPKKHRGIVDIRLRTDADPELDDEPFGTSGTSAVQQVDAPCSNDPLLANASNPQSGTSGTSVSVSRIETEDGVQCSLVESERNIQKDVPDVPSGGLEAFPEFGNRINWVHVRNRLEANDLRAIRVHCALAQADYESVIAFAAKAT